jgi:hypothetical protein
VTAAVVLSALLFWCCVFAVFFATQETSALEFVLGRYEPLPAHLGQWQELGVDGQTGLLREERFLLPSGRPNAGHLLHQVRLRDPETQTIVRVERERRVRRRRVSAR